MFGAGPSRCSQPIRGGGRTAANCRGQRTEKREIARAARRVRNGREKYDYRIPSLAKPLINECIDRYRTIQFHPFISETSDK